MVKGYITRFPSSRIIQLSQDPFLRAWGTVWEDCLRRGVAANGERGALREAVRYEARGEVTGDLARKFWG